MDASEMIKVLQAKIEEHGDLPVRITTMSGEIADAIEVEERYVEDDHETLGPFEFEIVATGN